MRFFYTVIAAIITVFTVGCDRDNGWNMITTKDGLVYRINKQTGETALIVGTQATKVEEISSNNTSDSKTNHVVNWLTLRNDPLGGLTLHLKTNWRDGKIYYIFSESPYAGRVKSERSKIGSTAQFFVRLYDGDGFEIFTIPINLSEMVSSWDDTNSVGSLSVNMSSACSLETYEAIKVWNVGWSGFPE